MCIPGSLPAIYNHMSMHVRDLDLNIISEFVLQPEMAMRYRRSNAYM